MKKFKDKFVSVGVKPWKQLIVEVIRAYPKRMKFTYDQVRLDARLQGILPPKNPNAWGGAMVAAVQDGFIRRTGTFVPSSNKSNHGRMMAEWIRL